MFNDDKKTDLIGETWVDLRDLIIPGGGQRDNWHPLQCRGRYAGEVRIEMTYYDTRPEDETVVEKRSLAAERIQAKATGSAPTGNRQVKDIKRRPLPGDPNVPAHARPGPPEKNYSAPQLPSTRSFAHEPQGWSDNSRQGLRQPATTAPAVMPPEAPYETSTISGPPGPRPLKGYDNPDERSRPSTAPKSQPVIHQPTPVHPPVSLPQIPSTKRFYNEQPYTPREPASDPYEAQPRTQYARPHSSYETAPPTDYNPSWQDVFPGRKEIQQAPEQPYEARPRQNSTRGYDLAAEQQQMYGDEPASYGPSAKYSQRSLRSMPVEQIQPEYMEPEPERHYQHRNSIASTHRNALRHSISHEVPSMGYASMQPSVEDEEEEGPPPPPPVHRSGVGVSQSSRQRMMPSPTPSYKAYSTEYASSPRASDDVNFSSQPSHYVPDNVRLQDLPPHNNSASSMPPSLVPGFDPMIADEETERLYHERRESRRRSTMFDDDSMMAPQPLVPQPQPQPQPVEPAMPPYPVDPPSQPAMEDRGSMSGALVRSRGGSYTSTDSRIVPQRKSVSPQPPPVEERPPIVPVATQIPFSPDSFDALNPNISRAVLGSNPAEEEAAKRREQEASKEPGPIIGDDGREIDPSDHLPSDTWAPEPEKKTKKPELVVRFKSPPAQATSPRPPVTRESRPIRVTFKPQSQGVDRTWERPASSSNSRQRSPGPGAMERTSPRMEMARGRDMYSYGRGQSYSRSPGVDSSQSSSRTSVSPSPGSSATSSLYAPVSTGPPIPAKVPIAQPMNQSYPMIASSHYSYGVPERGGIEALSRELNTIDIGGVGSNTNRAMRKYVPRVTMGYAS